MTRRWALGLFAAYAAALFTGTHWPRLELPRLPQLIPTDKILHFCGYSLLAGLLIGLPLGVLRRADGSLRSPPARYGLSAWALIAACAFLDESTQPLVDRDFEWLDLVADTSGALLAIALVTNYLLRRAGTC